MSPHRAQTRQTATPMAPRREVTSHGATHPEAPAGQRVAIGTCEWGARGLTGGFGGLGVSWGVLGGVSGSVGAWQILGTPGDFLRGSERSRIPGERGVLGTLRRLSGSRAGVGAPRGLRGSRWVCGGALGRAQEVPEGSRTPGASSGESEGGSWIFSGARREALKPWDPPKFQRSRTVGGGVEVAEGGPKSPRVLWGSPVGSPQGAAPRDRAGGARPFHAGSVLGARGGRGRPYPGVVRWGEVVRVLPTPPAPPAPPWACASAPSAG